MQLSPSGRKFRALLRLYFRKQFFEWKCNSKLRKPYRSSSEWWIFLAIIVPKLQAPQLANVRRRAWLRWLFLKYRGIAPQRGGEAGFTKIKQYWITYIFSLVVKLCTPKSTPSYPNQLYFQWALLADQILVRYFLEGNSKVFLLAVMLWPVLTMLLLSLVRHHTCYGNLVRCAIAHRKPLSYQESRLFCGNRQYGWLIPKSHPTQ